MHLEGMRSPWNIRGLKFWPALIVLGVMGTVRLGHADDRQAPDCLLANKTVLYRAYGYDHMVELRNTCPSTVSCELSSDGTEAQQVVVEPSEQKHLLLRRGSPAREFEYRLVCTGGG